MSHMEFEIIQTIALILGPGGAVFLGLKGALNGMRSDIKQNTVTLARVEDNDAEMHRDITAIKTIVERQ